MTDPATKRMWVLVTPRGRVCWETVSRNKRDTPLRLSNIPGRMPLETPLSAARRLGYRFARVRCEVEP